MARWRWDNVKTVRGWTEFEDYFDVTVELQDGHVHVLKVRSCAFGLIVEHLVDGEALPDE